MIVFSPHNDDSELFCCYTIMREKPKVIVVTDGFIQGRRGDPVTWDQRRRESEAAARVLGVDISFLGIPDTDLHEYNFIRELEIFSKDELVYCPAEQGGNAQHDLVSKVCRSYFKNVVQYTTYTKTELWTKGDLEVSPTPEEIEMKNKALNCYQSQINLSSTRPHFDAVRGKSEWLI